MPMILWNKKDVWYIIWVNEHEFMSRDGLLMDLYHLFWHSSPFFTSCLNKRVEVGQVALRYAAQSITTLLLACPAKCNYLCRHPCDLLFIVRCYQFCVSIELCALELSLGLMIHSIKAMFISNSMSKYWLIHALIV